MPIEITMPALSPTMEEGNLARWMKKVGDPVRAGDVLAEIETDKATMEVEAIDEGTLAEIRVADGTEGVKVGTVIGVIAVEGEAATPPPSASTATPPVNGEGTKEDSPPLRSGGGGGAAAGGGATLPPEVRGYGANPLADAKLAADEHRAQPTPSTAQAGGPPPPRAGEESKRVNASPLARRLAEMRGVELAGLAGSGPNGRIVKADVDGAVVPAEQRTPTQPSPQGGGLTEVARTDSVAPVRRAVMEAASQAPKPAVPAPAPTDIPHEAVKLSQMRKVIARRLTESKQTVPHYYLAIDCRLDALLKLRAELNAAQPVKLSVNDLLIKALAIALRQVPDANVSYTGEALIKYSRADISVAVAIPDGLITPIIVGADTSRLSDIATAMKDLAARAKDGKLQPHEYQGGTASLSNLGMYGIRQFSAVINPPQGMILAVGAGDRRPWVEGESLVAATVLTATGSFDHRAIDGAVGAQLMAAVRDLVEKPLGMLV